MSDRDPQPVRKRVPVSVGIAAATVVVVFGFFLLADLMRPEPRSSKLVGIWEELPTRPGDVAPIVQFTDTGEFRVWEGGQRENPPSKRGRFELDGDEIVVGGDEFGRCEFGVDGDLMWLKTNTLQWFRRHRAKHDEKR